MTFYEVNLMVRKECPDAVQPNPTSPVIALLHALSEAGWVLQNADISTVNTPSLFRTPEPKPPIELNELPHQSDLAMMDHLHVNGECVKNRYGVRCS